MVSKAELDEIKKRVDDHDDRIVDLEKGALVRDGDAKLVMQKLEQIDRHLQDGKQMSQKLLLIVAGGFISAAVAFILKGGLTFAG